MKDTRKDKLRQYLKEWDKGTARNKAEHEERIKMLSQIVENVKEFYREQDEGRSVHRAEIEKELNETV